MEQVLVGFIEENIAQQLTQGHQADIWQVGDLDSGLQVSDWDSFRKKFYFYKREDVLEALNLRRDLLCGCS